MRNLPSVPWLDWIRADNTVGVDNMVEPVAVHTSGAESSRMEVGEELVEGNNRLLVLVCKR
jgi:hypothetical protein